RGHLPAQRARRAPGLRRLAHVPGRSALARSHPLLRVLPRRQRRGARRQPSDRLDRHRRAPDADVFDLDGRRATRAVKGRGSSMKKTLIAAMCAALVAVVEAAPKIKVKAEPDPAFDFATVKSWARDPTGGDVIMARTAKDDPAPLKARVDPLIRKFVGTAMTQKGLADAGSGTPGVYLHYYV